MTDTWNDYKRLSAGHGAFELPDWSVIEISGDDWREWLQGQITGDVRQLSPEKPVGFCLTKPTGQILSFGELSEHEGKGWLTVPEATVPVILQRVESAVILEDCSAELLKIPVAWLDGRLRPGIEGASVSVPAWRLFWLCNGIPNWSFDVQEKTLPPELGERFSEKHLNYNKGCYTGQEVLQRIHSRGHTNRTWVVEQSEVEGLSRPGFEQTNQALHPDGYWLVGGYQRNQVPTSSQAEA